MSEQNDSLSIESVRALVGERARFDDWLSALEARRENTPVHVFQRVHGDYTARRSEVIGQLARHVPALQSLLTTLDARAETLGATMASHEDERAEAMLRHAVGEFDDAAWDEVRGRVESTLEQLFGEQVALEEQRDDVRHLLTQSTPPEGWSVPASDAVPPHAPNAAAPDDQLAAVESAPHEAPAEAAVDVAAVAPASPTAPLDTHIATPSWLGGADAVADAAPADPVPADAADRADAVRPATVTETLASIDADVVEELPPEPSRSETPAGLERPSIWGGGAPAAAESRPAVEAPAATQDTFDELAFLRSVIDPQSGGASGNANGLAMGGASVGAPQKTLRCTECGTLNLPTEWYCERCGSELASF
jgi:hypothetical protein